MEISRLEAFALVKCIQSWPGPGAEIACLESRNENKIDINMYVCVCVHKCRCIWFDKEKSWMTYS